MTTTSLSGYLGQFRETVYGTSKSALHGFVRYVATQYGRFGVRSVGIAPGLPIPEDAVAKGIDAYLPVLRRHTPYSRLGRPEDIGYTAAFLASDEAGYINGTTILVDGGFSAHFASYADDLAEIERQPRGGRRLRPLVRLEDRYTRPRSELPSSSTAPLGAMRRAQEDRQPTHGDRQIGSSKASRDRRAQRRMPTTRTTVATIIAGARVMSSNSTTRSCDVAAR